MFCKNCGEPLKDGASFCTECGWKVVNNVNDAGTNVSNPGIGDQDDFSDDCYVLDCGDGALLGMAPFAN